MSMADQPATRSHHTWGLGSGLNRIHHRDDLISPLMYEGTAIPFYGFYCYQGKVVHHAVRLWGAQTTKRSSISDGYFEQQMDEFRGVMEYGMNLPLHRFHRFSGEIRWGISVQTIGARHKHSYRRQVIETYYDGVAMVGPSLLAISEVNRRLHIQLEMTLPIFFLWARQPYAVRGPMDVVFSSWHECFSGKLNTCLEWRVSQRVGLQFNYLISYLWFSEPRTTTSAIEYFTISVSFHH